MHLSIERLELNLFFSPPSFTSQSYISLEEYYYMNGNQINVFIDHILICTIDPLD